MPSVLDDGTQSATPGTEHTLTTITSSSTCILAVDTSNLAGVEVVELRVYMKVLSTSAEVLMHRGTYGPGAPALPGVASVPVVSPHSFRATLKQIGGSSRDFDWHVVEV